MKFFLILILLLLSSCRWFSGADTNLVRFTNYKVPDGTPLFQKGFGDGCSSAFHVRGTGFYRDRYDLQYDPSLIDNPEYKFGYSRGVTNCFEYTVGGRHTVGGSADTYIYGGNWGPTITMGRGNIDSTVKYETGSWQNPLASGDGIDSMFGIVQKGKGGTGANAMGEGSHPFWGTWNSDQIFGWSDK